MTTFTVFFDANYSLMVGVAERRLGSLHDAEDVATEAFRIAWERHVAGEPLNVPWLYGVVRNLIGNHYRSRERRAALEERAGHDAIVAATPCHEPGLDVTAALDRLPDEQREVIVMAYWDELTTVEIAGVLGLSPVAVRARLSRARRLLRAYLKTSPECAMQEVTTNA